MDGQTPPHSRGTPWHPHPHQPSSSWNRATRSPEGEDHTTQHGNPGPEPGRGPPDTAAPPQPERGKRGDRLTIGRGPSEGQAPPCVKNDPGGARVNTETRHTAPHRGGGAQANSSRTNRWGAPKGAGTSTQRAGQPAGEHPRSQPPHGVRPQRTPPTTRTHTPPDEAHPCPHRAPPAPRPCPHPQNQEKYTPRGIYRRRGLLGGTSGVGRGRTRPTGGGCPGRSWADMVYLAVSPSHPCSLVRCTFVLATIRVCGAWPGQGVPGGGRQGWAGGLSGRYVPGGHAAGLVVAGAPGAPELWPCGLAVQGRA